MNVKALQHQFDNNLAHNSCQHQRKVINLQKLDKKRQISQSLSWISRIKQRLWGRDGNPTGGSQSSRRKSSAKEEGKDEKCSTLPRNVRLGIVHENPRILSDGESEEISGTSSEDYVSPVKLRNRPRRANDWKLPENRPLTPFLMASQGLRVSRRCDATDTGVRPGGEDQGGPTKWLLLPVLDLQTKLQGIYYTSSVQSPLLAHRTLTVVNQAPVCDITETKGEELRAINEGSLIAQESSDNLETSDSEITGRY
uniref:Uncharacterized protein n=1 Tax=Magallana gigas TaxID=29159 RepID=K1RUR2_MAGGI